MSVWYDNGQLCLSRTVEHSISDFHDQGNSEEARLLENGRPISPEIKIFEFLGHAAESESHLVEKIRTRGVSGSWNNKESLIYLGTVDNQSARP